jgi:hypothetical protein
MQSVRAEFAFALCEKARQCRQRVAPNAIARRFGEYVRGTHLANQRLSTLSRRYIRIEESIDALRQPHGFDVGERNARKRRVFYRELAVISGVLAAIRRPRGLLRRRCCMKVGRQRKIRDVIDQRMCAAEQRR